MSMSVATTPNVTRTLRLFSLLLVLLPATLLAQSGIWGARGISRQFLVRGNQVIAIDGRGVASYDVSDPSHVRRISAIQRDDESLSGALLGTTELAVLTRGGIDRYAIGADGALTLHSELPLSGYTAIFGNGQLLAGAGVNGLTIWRASEEGLDPIGQFATNGVVNAVAFHGNAVYAGIEGIATYVFSLDGGADPIAIIATNSRGLAVSGDVLYSAAAVNGLVAYDISNDAAPRELARLEAGSVNLQAVAASGTRVYASEAGNLIHVYDTSSGVPVELSTISEPVNVMAASGTRLFVSGSIVDQYGLALETGAPLRVFDTSTLAAPKLAGEYRDLAGPVSGVATDGSLAYVVDPPFFRVLDISKTAAPQQIASLEIAGIQDRVRVHGKTALIYGRGNVNVVDVTNPYSPRLLTTFQSNGIPPSSASMTGDELVEGNPASGFHVVDFRHYAPPAQVGGLKGHYWEVVARDNAGYLFEIGGIRVLDLSNRNDVQIVQNLQLAGRAAEIIDATETHPELLLVYSPTGMQLFTLANRLDPIMSGSLHYPQGGSFAASGNTAWFAQPGVIDEINISDPAHPEAAPTFMRVTAPMQMAASGRKIVVADRYSLRIYGPDTAAPAQPVIPKRRAAGRS
jgi:hypothetical protein